VEKEDDFMEIYLKMEDFFRELGGVLQT